MRASEDLLCNLLAVIHRDGGQHTQRVGIEQSTTDATRSILALISDNDEHQRTFELIQRAERRAIAKWRAQDLAKRELFLPDSMNLIVWLLKQLEEREDQLRQLRESGGTAPRTCIQS